MTRARLLPLALLVALGTSGCGDFLFDEEPGAAAIRVTYAKPVTDSKRMGELCDRFGDEDGLSQTSCSTTVAVFVFDEKATGSQVAALALELRKQDNVADVLVSVVDEEGDGIVRP